MSRDNMPHDVVEAGQNTSQSLDYITSAPAGFDNQGTLLQRFRTSISLINAVLL
jgi:hypothetical protein